MNFYGSALKVLVLLFVAGVLTGLLAGHLLFNKTGPPGPVDIIVKDKPLDAADLESDRPATIVFYDTTTVVKEVKVYVPVDLVGSKVENLRKLSTYNYSTPLSGNQLRAELALSPLKFLILPLVDGYPAVRVTRKQTYVQTYDPISGRGIEFGYPHPSPVWDIRSSLDVAITGRTLSAGIAIGIQYKRYIPYIGYSITMDNDRVLSKGMTYGVKIDIF